ncbi:hypothetical protein FCIRC_2646 [Fusarium circinatum]|uniref:Uncharacterized protein n=1 Tax=Fusarium circinatum TaxID=48490 RepID=A0A8H5UGU1_FUSCI|nr:hypothetical protein FCIRC_2646 [Fusarium circinatum]
MKFTTTLLLLTPLAASGPAISTAEGLTDLATSGKDGYSVSHGEALQLAAKVCPAKSPRKGSIDNFCCRTKKYCKKECCKNTARYCSAGQCYR